MSYREQMTNRNCFISSNALGRIYNLRSIPTDRIWRGPCSTPSSLQCKEQCKHIVHLELTNRNTLLFFCISPQLQTLLLTMPRARGRSGFRYTYRSRTHTSVLTALSGLFVCLEYSNLSNIQILIF